MRAVMGRMLGSMQGFYSGVLWCWVCCQERSSQNRLGRLGIGFTEVGGIIVCTENQSLVWK